MFLVVIITHINSFHIFAGGHYYTYIGDHDGNKLFTLWILFVLSPAYVYNNIPYKHLFVLLFYYMYINISFGHFTVCTLITYILYIIILYTNTNLNLISVRHPHTLLWDKPWGHNALSVVIYPYILNFLHLLLQNAQN